MIRLSETSHLEIFPNAIPCTKQEFDALWAECPETKDKISLYGKTHDVPRFQRVYGQASYSFSGMTLVPNPILPPLVQRCLDLAREQYPPASQWNGALVNFYPNGDSYIGFHSDDERDLVSGAPILSFSFGGERIFVVQEKKKGVGYIKEVKIPTKHASMIAMCGNMQTEFVHGVPKATKREGEVSPRINITVRSFRAAETSKKMKLDTNEE
jgi:alkylated DNA repair dioxygenase AlkB